MDQRINQLEFSIFFRNKAAWSGILILLISGFAGMYFGKGFIQQQQQVIEKAKQLQQENTTRNIQYFGKELGTLLYHNQFSIANIPDNWTAFSTGQRDINPYLFSVTILGLEGQMYDTDLNNPITLLAGNMDLAFVFVFLFPLVIIAFTYNLLSSERESGIWSLLKSQSAIPLRVIWLKFSVRLIAVFASALLLMLISAFYLQLAFDLRFFMVCGVISLYLLFWFALSLWVISRGRSSDFNAVSLIACWVVLNIVSPAVLNVWLTKKFPVPEALETVVTQREGYHEKWDLDKQSTMARFFQHYPQFRKYPFPADAEFSWYWYYAMQQMGDDEAAGSTERLAEKLTKRQNFSAVTSLFLPGIQAQLKLNELANADLQQHLHFLKALRAYHEKLRLQFYPVIFSGAKATDIDWKSFKLEAFSNQQAKQSLSALFSMAFFSLLFLLLAVYNFRRKADHL